MSIPHCRLTTFLLRFLSFLLLISLARFFFLLSLPSFPHPSPDLPTPEPSSIHLYSSVFQSLIADGFLSLDSKSLCITRTGQEVAALKLAGVPNSVGVKLTDRNRKFLFKNDTFDFIFSSDLDSSFGVGKVALGITRMLKIGGFLIVHTLSKDDYSLNSLLNLFKSFMFIRSREINSGDSTREIILMKQNHSGTLVNKGPDQGHNRNLISYIEPLINDEPLKPWVAFKRNLRNITYLPSIVDISFKTRYIYIDVGARTYSSSIGNWFIKQYPKQNKFFEIFAIEPNNIFHEGYQNRKRVTLVPYAAWTRNETLFYEIGHKQIRENKERGRGLGRAQSAQSAINFVNDFHKIEGFDFIKWLKDSFSETDFVVLKMDVEGSEFHLIQKLFESGAIYLVDELFVVCYYNRWEKCCPGQRSVKYRRTYKACLGMLNFLRDRGVFVHQWWRIGNR